MQEDMGISSTLNREIVRHILGSLGMVPPPNFGKVGISTNEFRQQKCFDLEFENKYGKMERVSFALWGGQIVQNGSIIKALGTDVCDDDGPFHEFSIVYQVDSSPIHGIKHLFAEEGEALYIIKSGKEWKQIGAAEKLITCAGFLTLNSQGINWNPYNTEHLLPQLLEIVEM
jgi:hypothetical protein